jgi:hypothetical protein
MAKRMTSRARLLAAIHHQEPDRVPVGPRIWAWLLERYGSQNWPYALVAAREFDFDPLICLDAPYANYIGDLRADGEQLSDVRINLQIERSEQYSFIRRTVHTPAGTLSDAVRQFKPGSGYGADPNPEWLERLIKDSSDLPALRYLLQEARPEDFRDIVAVQGLVGEQGLVQVYIHSPLDHRAGWTMNMADFMAATIQQPELVRDLLDLFQHYTLAQIRCALQAGLQAVFVPWYFASMSAGWSPAFYARCLLPLVKEQVALVHEYGAIYHYYDDGKSMTILPWLAEAGVDIVSTVPPPPMGDVDLAEAKHCVGERICLNGNIDIVNVIKDGTPELIQERVRQAILVAAPGGGFVLGTSDSIRDAPPANVSAYFQAARRFGIYAHLGKNA